MGGREVEEWVGKRCREWDKWMDGWMGRMMRAESRSAQPLALPLGLGCLEALALTSL
jgi:hypothetical protein